MFWIHHLSLSSILRPPPQLSSFLPFYSLIHSQLANFCQLLCWFNRSTSSIFYFLPSFASKKQSHARRFPLSLPSSQPLPSFSISLFLFLPPCLLSNTFSTTLSRRTNIPSLHSGHQDPSRSSLMRSNAPCAASAGSYLLERFFARHGRVQCARRQDGERSGSGG